MRSYTIISSIVAVCGKFPGTDDLIEKKRGRIEEFGRDDVFEPMGTGDLMADFREYLRDPGNRIAPNRLEVSKRRKWMKPHSESIPLIVSAFILDSINLGIPLEEVVASIAEEYQGLAMFDVPALVEMADDAIYAELLEEMTAPDFFGPVTDDELFPADLFEMGIDESLSSGSLDDMGESKAFDMGALYPSPLGIADRPSPTFSIGSNPKPVKSHSAKHAQKRKAARKAGGNGVN